MSVPARPGSLHIRPARADEKWLIRRLVVGAGLDPTSLKWRNFLLAEVEGQVVGCGQVKPYPGCRELGSLVVRRRFRRQGIGRALVEALLARERGDVYLLCRGRMRSYYARFGFEEIGLRAAPWVIRLKLCVGQAMAALAGMRVAAMRRRAQP